MFKHNLYDLAHEFANIVKLVLNFVQDKSAESKKKFTKKHQEFEQKKLKRFLAIGTKVNDKTVLPPWKATSQSVHDVDSLPTLPGSVNNNDVLACYII